MNALDDLYKSLGGGWIPEKAVAEAK